MDEYNDFWGSTDFAYTCLIDNERTEKFQHAIRDSVKMGDVVIDAGSGTGILGLFALEAGAKHVYFIEINLMLAKALERTLELSKFSKAKYTILTEDVLSVVIPEKVDVIICEMIATGLIDELQIDAIRHLSKFAKDQVQYIPRSIDCYVDLVNDKIDFYGYELNIVRYEYGKTVTCQNWKAKEMTDKYKYLSIDFSEVQNDENINVNTVFECISSGIINGIRISNNTQLSDNTEITSSLSYCMPIILPNQPISVKKGDRVNLELSYKLCGGFRNLDYKLTLR